MLLIAYVLIAMVGATLPVINRAQKLFVDETNETTKILFLSGWQWVYVCWLATFFLMMLLNAEETGIGVWEYLTATFVAMLLSWIVTLRYK